MAAHSVVIGVHLQVASQRKDPSPSAVNTTPLMFTDLVDFRIDAQTQGIDRLV